MHKVHIAFPRLSLPEFLASMLTDQGGDILGSCMPNISEQHWLEKMQH